MIVIKTIASFEQNKKPILETYRKHLCLLTIIAVQSVMQCIVPQVFRPPAPSNIITITT